MVGFHVALTRSFGRSGKIPFDRIISNYGNGWNKNTHVFNVPTKGLYFFILTVMNTGTKDVNAWIMHGSTRIAQAHADERDLFNVGTVSTVLLLNIGEEVYVQHDRGTLLGISPQHYTYCAGFLIQKYS